MARAPVDPAQLEIRRLASEDGGLVGDFCCGDDDLDDFLRTDAARLQEQNVVRTFVALYEGALVGYIALLMDAVELKLTERKKLALRFGDHPIVPALKVARLGVSAAFRASHRGGGESLVRFAYAKALDLAEHVGCRLLTLDAYEASIVFYERLGFVRNQAKVYEGKNHPSMRLDLFAREAPAWLSGERGLPEPVPGAGS